MTAAVALAQSLVRLPTLNPPGDEAAAAELLGARLERAGFAVEVQEWREGRKNVVARLRRGGDRSPLCFTGHLDTVPLGAAPWRGNPFAGEVAGGRLFGRGSSDMKAGVAALVVAAERIAALGGGENGLVLVLCAGEETGCEGARALALTPGLLGEAGAVLVGEPTSNYPRLAHKGALWLRATTRGRTAHGSMPHLGVNAVYAMARAVSRLEAFTFDVPGHALLGRPTLNVGTIRGGINVNSVPDSCSAGIDVRTVPGLSGDQVLQVLRDVIGDGVELERTVDTAPVATDPDDPWAREVFEIMAPLIGETPEPRGVDYFTDASVLTSAYGGVPTVVCGPGEAGQAHGTDEWCSVERIDAAVEGYTEIARRWMRL
jgi:succinyl-diaminopimelate desuccinylase